MPSAQIRVIIVSGEPHFHQGLINVRIWIKINMLTAPVSPLCLFESIVFYTKRAELKVPVWMCRIQCGCAHLIHRIRTITCLLGMSPEQYFGIKLMPKFGKCDDTCLSTAPLLLGLSVLVLLRPIENVDWTHYTTVTIDVSKGKHHSFLLIMRLCKQQICFEIS